MKVKFKTGLAGLDFSYGPGEIVNVDDGWAEKLIEGNLVEKVSEPDGIETDNATGNAAGDTGASQGVRKTGRK